MRSRALCVVPLFLASCASTTSTPRDAGIAFDAALAPVDGGEGGAGEVDAADASADPARALLLGQVTGACGDVRAELTRATPSLFENHLAFAAGEAYGKASLSPGGQRMFDTPNAGGSSLESEVISFEVLRHCEGATLLKTETEIAYAPPDDAGPSTISDVLVEIDGRKVGLSVTRAYRPASQTMSDADVKELIERKLVGINRSTVRVLPADRWVKQVLHVFAVTPAAVEAVKRVYAALDASTKGDTVVLLTRTTGGGFLYCEPDPPLGSECP